MYIYDYIHRYIHTYINLCTQIYTYSDTHTHTHNTHTHTHMAFRCVCHIRVSHMYVCVYAWMYVCMYDDVTYVYDDVTYVYDDVTYIQQDVRKTLINNCVQILYVYRKFCATNPAAGQLILPGVSLICP